MIGTYFLANVFISKPILFLLSSLFERKEVKMKRSLFKRGGEFLTVFQIPKIFLSFIRECTYVYKYMWMGCCFVGQWCNVCMNDRSFLSSIHHISKFRAKKLRNDPCLRTFLESSNDKSILSTLSHIQKYAFWKRNCSICKNNLWKLYTNQRVQNWSHKTIGS